MLFNCCNRSKVLSDHLFIKILLRHKKQKSVHQNLNCLNPTEGPQLSDLVSTIYMCMCIYILYYIDKYVSLSHSLYI